MFGLVHWRAALPPAEFGFGTIKSARYAGATPGLRAAPPARSSAVRAANAWPHDARLAGSLSRPLAPLPHTRYNGPTRDTAAR
jgi:hypothetical protein